MSKLILFVKIELSFSRKNEQTFCCAGRRDGVGVLLTKKYSLVIQMYVCILLNVFDRRGY